jgi:hypothetical protein
MVTHLFHPFEEELSPYTQDEFQSSLGSYDACPFGNSYLFYEVFQSPSDSKFDGHKDVASPEWIGTHTTEQQFSCLGSLFRDIQMKGQHFFSTGRISFSNHKDIPCLYSYSLGIDTILF